MTVDVAQWEDSNIKCYVSVFSIILMIYFMHLINKKITSKKKNTDEQKIKAPKMYREGQKKAKEGNLLKERKTTKKKKLKEIKKGKGQKKLKKEIY